MRSGVEERDVSAFEAINIGVEAELRNKYKILGVCALLNAK